MSLEPKGYLKVKQWIKNHIAAQNASKSRRRWEAKSGKFGLTDDLENDVQRQSSMDIGPIDPEFFSLK